MGWLTDKITSFAIQEIKEEEENGTENGEIISTCREIIEETEIKKSKITFIPLNNNTNRKKVSGSHWSLLVYRKIGTKGEFLHFDPIKGMNKNTAQEMVDKLNKIEKTKFIKKVREMEGPKQSNGYDCGVYTILMIRKILEKLRMKENIESITIEPREAEKLRTQLREKLREPRRLSNIELKKPEKKLHKNYIYFR